MIYRKWKGFCITFKGFIFHQQQHKYLFIFKKYNEQFYIAALFCTQQNMQISKLQPIHRAHTKICHSTIFTNKYAMYSSSQPLHTAHNNIRHVILLTIIQHFSIKKNMHVFFFTATPKWSQQNMPCIPTHSH